MADVKFKEQIIDFFQVRVRKGKLYQAFDKKKKAEQELEKLKKTDHEKLEKLRRKLQELTDEWLRERKNAESELVPDWLDVRIEDARSFVDIKQFKKDKRFRKATHLLKFGDSASYPGSINCFQYRSGKSSKDCKRYISTDSLRENSMLDISYNNGRYITPALFLMLADGSETIFDKVIRRDLSVFEMFSSDADRVNRWADAFLALVDNERKIYPEEAKQLYFPDGDGYHLLCPLFSSSLSHSIYESCVEIKFSAEMKEVREAYKNKKYSDSQYLIYPQLAHQSFGGAHPNNVSPLNHVRNGKSHMLTCQPPHWQKQATPPSKDKNSFWQEYDRRVWKTAKYLQKYLENIFSKSSTMGRREFRAELVDELIDKLLNYAVEVQNLKQHAGWSIDSKLSKAEQLWLDPHRCDDDAEFKAEREKNDWQTEIAKQFAAWLNHKISHNSDTLYADDDMFNYWKKLLKGKLTLLKEDLEVMV